MRRLIQILILMLIVMILPLSGLAMGYENYDSFRYNSWNEAVKTPEPYIASRIISGQSLGIADFTSPTDMFAADGKLYILDPTSNRVVILDEALDYERSIEEFNLKGSEYSLSKDASGIFVDDKGHIYIADTGNKKIIVSDQEGEIVYTFTKPESSLYPSETDFKPTKVLVDSSGNTYVLVAGLYYGAVVYNPQGDFQSFFGTNHVKLTSSVLIDYFWKKIMTEDQKKQLGRYVPVAYTNMYIDNKNFIFTCTESSLRKLNPGGKEVTAKTEKSFFGDYYTVWDHGKPIKTIFTDLVVEESGLISLLDSTRGRIFQYSRDFELLYAFGGSGTQKGTFRTPVAIEAMGEYLLVLDSRNSNITVFEPTAFAEKVREASRLYSNGDYEESQNLWIEVLTHDANYELAYSGLGKAHFNMGEFKLAMNSFKLGEDKENYTLAKKEYRTILLQKYFPLIGSLVVILMITLAFFMSNTYQKIKIRRGRKKNAG